MPEFLLFLHETVFGRKRSPKKSKPVRRWPCIFGKGIVKYYQIEAE